MKIKLNTFIKNLLYMLEKLYIYKKMHLCVKNHSSLTATKKSAFTPILYKYYFLGNILVLPPIYGCNALGILIEPSGL